MCPIAPEAFDNTKLVWTWPDVKLSITETEVHGLSKRSFCDNIWVKRVEESLKSSVVSLGVFSFFIWTLFLESCTALFNTNSEGFQLQESGELLSFPRSPCWVLMFLTCCSRVSEWFCRIWILFATTKATSVPRIGISAKLWNLQADWVVKQTGVCTEGVKFWWMSLLWWQ